VVEAIQAGNSVEARRAMEEHIRSIDPKVFGLRGVERFAPLPGIQEIRTVGGIH
jgi:hypothetical protein